MNKLYIRSRNLKLLSDSKQVCLVPNPNSQSSVLIQLGKKLIYALPMKTDYEEKENLKRYNVKDCPNNADKDNIF